MTRDNANARAQEQYKIRSDESVTPAEALSRMQREIYGSRLMNEGVYRSHEPIWQVLGDQILRGFAGVERSAPNYWRPDMYAAGDLPAKGATDSGHHIAEAARAAVGQALWRRTDFAHDVAGGRLGCAASVSERLNSCGYDYAKSAGVGQLVDQLKAHGWTEHPISQARPGDVVYGFKGRGWRGGGGNAHVGIMGEDGHCFANSSASGRWKEGDLGRIIPARRFGSNRFCLRPPGAGSDNQSQPRQFEPDHEGREELRPPQFLSQTQYQFEPRGIDAERAMSVVTNSQASPQERLAAVRALALNGINHVNMRGPDGAEFSLRTEVEQIGNNQCVHLFMSGPDGRERVVMRGVFTDRGVERQVDRSGNQVSWCGSAGAAFDRMFGKSGEACSFVPQDNQSSRLESIYEQYRQREEQRENQVNPFDQDGHDSGSNNASLNQIIDEAARRASGSANRLVQTENGVYMRAGMDIDADGSPRARQIDPDGQRQTSWRLGNGQYINAETVPYMVLPGGHYKQFGIKLGDMVLVRNRENGRTAVAVFADVGPSHKRGEGSIALAEQLGVNPSPTRGGTHRPSIEYLVMPGSGYPAQNEEQLLARIRAYRQRFGLS